MSRQGPESIPGWLGSADTDAFQWFLGEQVRAGESGDLAEPRWYLGRSAVLIGAFRQAGETFTVVDLFENTAPDQANSAENVAEYAGLTQAAFEANCQRVLGWVPTVVRGPSDEVTSHARHGNHPFVHVDASHLHDQVACDIASATVLLSKHGVVAFDDIRAARTPGVWAAVWEAALAGASSSSPALPRCVVTGPR